MPNRSDRGYKRQTLKELIGGDEYSPAGYDPLAYPAGQETPGEESYSYTDASGGALDSLMGPAGKKIDLESLGRGTVKED